MERNVSNKAVTEHHHSRHASLLALPLEGRAQCSCDSSVQVIKMRSLFPHESASELYFPRRGGLGVCVCIQKQAQH